MLVDPQDPGTRIVHALADLYLQQLLIPALDGGTPQPLALAKRPLRDPVVVGLEDLAPEGLRRAAAGAYAGEALVEVPSAALAEEFMAFEVKPGRPRPEIGMAQSPDEAVLLPKLRAPAPRAARSQERTGMEVNGLHPLHLDDFQERQPDYTGVGLGHGILLNNGSLNQLLRMPAPVFDVEPDNLPIEPRADFSRRIPYRIICWGRCPPPPPSLRKSPRDACPGRVLPRHRAFGRLVQHDAAVAQGSHLGHVQALELDLGGDAVAHDRIDDLVDHDRRDADVDQAGPRAHRLGHELAGVAEQDALHGSRHRVPPLAVRSVGEDSHRQDSPEAARAVDRDGADGVVDL